MAYDRQQLRVDWIFRVDGTDEIAITGCSVSGAADFDAAAALENFDTPVDGLTLDTAMQNLLSPAPIAWASYSTLTDIKVAALGTDGLYLVEPKIYSASSPASGSLEQIVPQQSVVLSLRSPTTLGRANYGRMYLPHCLLPLLAGTPTASVATADAAVADAQTFLNIVNDTFNVGSNPAVLQIMSSVGAGLSRGVTRCAIGTVNDTQRRRRNRISEVYSFATVSS